MGIGCKVWNQDKTESLPIPTKKSFRKVEIEQRKSLERSQVCVCVDGLQSVEGGRNVSQLCKINVIRNIDE